MVKSVRVGVFRIISTAVKCFDDVKMNIRQRCRHEGAEIYQIHYIQPLVERTLHLTTSQRIVPGLIHSLS